MELWKRSLIFGLRVWMVYMAIIVGAIIILFLFIYCLCIAFRRRKSPDLRRQRLPKHYSASGAVASNEMQEIRRDDADNRGPIFSAEPEVRIQVGKSELRILFPDPATVEENQTKSGEFRIITSGTDHKDKETSSFDSSGSTTQEGSHLGWGWGRRYTLRELEAATNGLSDKNLIGDGGSQYGTVYRGVLADNTLVAVKNLSNNSGQAEKEFEVEVEAVGRIKHKNLVRLLGYCVEGPYSMLVYEYVDNGNVDRWLHRDNAGDVSPLNWDIRMNILLGTARGLAYLHEGLEPKVIHRDIKSSNILLDRRWCPKVSDFGIAKLLSSESSYVTTRVTGAFGYVAPEYASSGMLNEKSDIYSYGILVMELITGRRPVDFSRPQGEVNLVVWLKKMVGNQKTEEIVDPKLPEMPSSKELKRVVLVALRCVDADDEKRPKMGHVVRILEADR